MNVMLTPSMQNWSFDKIAEYDHSRAQALIAAPSTAALLKAISNQFDTSLRVDRVRVGWEQSEKCQAEERVVFQFHVGKYIFDMFFNSRYGYRAMFYDHWESGLRFNDEIIESLRNRVVAISGQNLPARRLTASFEDCGSVMVPRAKVINSLAPRLAKIWFCSKLIQPDSGIEDLPSGLIGPRILLGDEDSWNAPLRDDGDAWLEVKGAFLGTNGPYQVKDPELRAQKIQLRGSA